MGKPGGFTFIEALTVIFLITLISAIAVPGMMKWRTEAKLRGAIENLKGDLELAKSADRVIRMKDGEVIS